MGRMSDPALEQGDEAISFHTTIYSGLPVTVLSRMMAGKPGARRNWLQSVHIKGLDVGSARF